MQISGIGQVMNVGKPLAVFLFMIMTAVALRITGYEPGAAYGCLNDEVTANFEQQFRSQYLDQTPSALTGAVYDWGLIAILASSSIMIIVMKVMVARLNTPNQEIRFIRENADSIEKTPNSSRNTNEELIME